MSLRQRERDQGAEKRPDRPADSPDLSVPLPLMENRLPVGPGSRGGRWHDPEYRRAYFRAWRAEHPEYRERDNLRRHERCVDEHWPLPRHHHA